MKIYRPSLSLGISGPPQTALLDKLGGLPWGLNPEDWPLCRFCGLPLSHVLQMRSHPQRLPLGKDKVLLGFQCARLTPGSLDSLIQTMNAGGSESDWMCHMREGVLVVVDESQLGNSLTYPPAPGAGVYVEARVDKWQESGTVQTAKAEPASRRGWWDRLIRRTPTPTPETAPPSQPAPEDDFSARLGGPPAWVRDNWTPPEGARFLGQFLSRHSLQAAPPNANQLGCSVGSPGCYDCQPASQFHGRLEGPGAVRPDGSGWSCSWMREWHSWSTGCVYLFLDADGKHGRLVWQWSDVLSCTAPF